MWTRVEQTKCRRCDLFLRAYLQEIEREGRKIELKCSHLILFHAIVDKQQ